MDAAGEEVTETLEQRAIKQKYHAMMKRLDPTGEYKVGRNHTFEPPAQVQAPETPCEPSPEDIYEVTPPVSPHTREHKTDEIIRLRHEMVKLETEDQASKQYKRYLEAKKRFDIAERKGNAYDDALKSLPKLETPRQQLDRPNAELAKNHELLTAGKKAWAGYLTKRAEQPETTPEEEARTLELEASKIKEAHS
ncbi:hypothetical protein QBC36DRAFT_295337 [Triangularia setosa]|uniref:Uncharacterized protein n=1 Tax=Triangularia setosa TaxID=2587417 RepID=A0AAN7A152_9PEZI|nr:hypothetical protein QBC36DRAFT_295337 [Podospora setosa]